MDARYDTACLAAPANTPFSIRFDNEDSDTHNLDIRKGGTSLFTGDIVVGPKITTYRVGPLPAGAYTFRCDVHPTQMRGTLVVSR
jgi:plastocyanin